MYQSDSFPFFVLLLYINGLFVTYSNHSHLNTQTKSNRMVDKVHSDLKSAQAHAKIGVLRRHTRSHVCSTVTSAATNACVFHQAHMVIKKNALATTTGKHRKENPSVLD
ncbi:hypothetical protein MKX03_031229 [Papaver bracteatum]|nr:hypothetical protein MKX03_031229 [Papaver bracteatum]